MDRESELIWERYYHMLTEQQPAPAQAQGQAQAAPAQTAQPAPVQAAQAPAAPAQAPAQPAKQTITTWGELKYIFKQVKSGAQKGVAMGVAIDAGITAAKAGLDLIPGFASWWTVVGGLKDAAAVYKKAALIPDNQAKTPLLQQLDIDDSILQIVDNNIELRFFNWFVQEMNKHQNEEPLPPNWDMTDEFIKFLRVMYQKSPGVQKHILPSGAMNQSQTNALLSKPLQQQGVMQTTVQ